MINEFSQDLEGITFVARAIRRDKGQLRADVSIRLKKRELDRDEFRFGDRTKRNAMANSAFRAIDGEVSTPAKDAELQLLLRKFLDMVEEEHTKSIEITDLPGLAEAEPPAWIIRDYVTEGALSLISAAPGLGKSWTGLLMAQSVQCGIPLIYGTNEPLPVLYINLERSAQSLQNRLGMVNRALGIDSTTSMPMLNARGRSMGEVRDAVVRHIERNQTGFFVLDSLSRMGMGSMVDDDSANAMMDVLNELTGRGAGGAILAHTPKPQGPGPAAQAMAERTYGSQMLIAAADFEIILRSKNISRERMLVGLKPKKANDAAKAPIAGWNYYFGAAGLERVARVPNELSDDAFEDD